MIKLGFSILALGTAGVLVYWLFHSIRFLVLAPIPIILRLALLALFVGFGFLLYAAIADRMSGRDLEDIDEDKNN